MHVQDSSLFAPTSRFLTFYSVQDQSLSGEMISEQGSWCLTM